MTPAIQIIIGALLLIAIILGAVFGVLRYVFLKRWAREREELAGEGVVLDSGLRNTTIRFKGYREPGFYSALGIRAGKISLLLTRETLAIFGFRSKRIPRGELHRYSVACADGRLILSSDNPVGATGHIEFRVSLDNPQEWADALRAAGALPAPAGG